MGARTKHNPRQKKEYHFQSCNICGKEFKALGKYQRFCHGCRHRSDAFSYYESWPHLSSQVMNSGFVDRCSG